MAEQGPAATQIFEGGPTQIDGNGSAKQSYLGETKLLDDLVGNTCETTMVVYGKLCLAVADSGATVTTIAESFRKSLPDAPLAPLGELLKVRDAGGHDLPYLGYTVLDIVCAVGGVGPLTVPALVVPDKEYHSRVPVLLGTNMLQLLHEQLQLGYRVWYLQKARVGSALQLALRAVEMKHKVLDDPEGISGTGQTVSNMCLKPGESLLLEGKVNTVAPNVARVPFVDVQKGTPPGLQVTPGVVQLCNDNKVVFEVWNSSEKDVRLHGKETVCSLSQVQVVEPVLEDNVSETEFMQQFKLDEEVLGHERLLQLYNSLVKYKNVFSEGTTDIGHTGVIKHRIDLYDSTPIREKWRSIPPPMFEEVRSHLNELLDSGVIRPSSSPWSFNMVFARRKDAGLRLCVDYRKLNQRTVRDAYQIPNVEDTLHALRGASWFSSLDMRSSYHQVVIEEEHIERTAFSAGPLGLFEWSGMP